MEGGEEGWMEGWMEGGMKGGSKRLLIDRRGTPGVFFVRLVRIWYRVRRDGERGRRRRIRRRGGSVSAG